MNKLILVLICGVLPTCQTIQKKEPSKQIEENRIALELLDDAKNILKNEQPENRLTNEDKTKIYAAIGHSETAIIESNETLKECITDKEKNKIQINLLSQAKIKQAKYLFYFILEHVLFLVILILFVLYKIKFAGFNKIIKTIENEKQILTDALDRSKENLK